MKLQQHIYEVKEDLFIYLFNNIYTGSKYQLQKLFFLQSPDLLHDEELQSRLFLTMGKRLKEEH